MGAVRLANWNYSWRDCACNSRPASSTPSFSKWTVLILTIVTVGLVVLFTSMTFQTPINMASNIGLGILLLLLAILDVRHRLDRRLHRFDSGEGVRLDVALFLLLPFFIGPLLYSFFGPKNTR